VKPVYLGSWRVDPTIREGVASPIGVRALAGAIAAALDAVDAPRPASIGLILSDDAELAELNEAHLGHEGPTDVLSFPLLGPEAFPSHAGGRDPEAPSRHGKAASFPRPPGQRIHLGDIVVSVERAAKQAAEGRGGQTGDVRWSAADELGLLVTHGALHICGWDHEHSEEEREMRALERRLLAPAR
jgi:probable rRNA maturation factor